jgi:hypothetical protein
MRKLLISIAVLCGPGIAAAQGNLLIPTPAYAASASRPPAAGQPQFFVQAMHLPFDVNAWIDARAQEGWRLLSAQVASCPHGRDTQHVEMVPCMVVAMSREPR